MSGNESRNRRAGVTERRRAGILLHPTSLPGARRHGTIGREAERFIDFLVEGGISVWQMLPIGPTHRDRSPYRSQSIHAGNPELIDPGRLLEWGWLPDGDAGGSRAIEECIASARGEFERRANRDERLHLERFCEENRGWLEDYALYRALRRAHRQAPWWEWPEALRARDATELGRARADLREDIAHHRFEQYLFARQWSELRGYAERNGVLMFGDMPIFVAEDSVDVWAEPHWFRTDPGGRLSVTTGVPPDAYSASGQQWGNPHYDWARLREDDFSWWKRRVRTDLARFDWVRVDHFRGFVAAWEIPAGSPDARDGHWVEAPGRALFAALSRELGPLPFVAEDLGYITPDVHALREELGFPGMKVLQFAFDGDPDNPYLPHHHARDCVVYPATHDNDTTKGWFETLPPRLRAQVREYLGIASPEMPWALLRMALASVGVLAVLPMQDVLGLGSDARMNTPSTSEGNWGWRFAWEQIPAGLTEDLEKIVGLYGRSVRRR